MDGLLFDKHLTTDEIEAAMKFANSDFGRKHHLRGINAKVIESGAVKQDDPIRRISQ